MQFTVQIDSNRASFIQHSSNIGNTLALNKKTELVLCGGLKKTYIYDLSANQLKPKLVKTIDNNLPKKWSIGNYDWNIIDSNKYLQTRDKIIEINDIETSSLLLTLNGHSRCISDSKWSYYNNNLLASCSMDSYIYIWNTETNKPVCYIDSIGELNCLSWQKTRDYIFAVSLNNDIKIYDLRKPNSVLRYITNAHSKLIYSLDWSPIKDCLLSCGRDKLIRIWHLDSDEKHSSTQVRLEDFPCWKAKYTNYGNSFGVIPVAQSQLLNQLYSPTIESLNNQISTSTSSCDLLLCNMNSNQEIKPYKYTTDKHEMIVDFDFNLNQQNDKSIFIGLTKDSVLVNCLIDSAHLPSITTALSTREILSKQQQLDDDSRVSTILNLAQVTTGGTNFQQPSITTTSSRKSSFSEHGGYGTPPTINFFQAHQIGSTANDENTVIINAAQLMKSSSRNVEINIPYPKLFGAKFSGLHENLVIFKNNNFTSFAPQHQVDQHATYPRLFTYQLNDRNKSKSLKIGKLPKVRSLSKQISTNTVVGKSDEPLVYIYDISAIINIHYDLALKYFNLTKQLIDSNDDNNIFNKIFNTQEINKIFNLVENITKNYETNVSLNPDHGRPWAYSSFGRDLINYLIDSYMKCDDLQTIVMILCKSIQHDSSIIPNASTLNRRERKKQATHNSKHSLNILSESFTATRLSNNGDDISNECIIREHSKNLGLLDLERINEFDCQIKAYCDILYKWGLNIKRAELYEYIRDKPSTMDKRFEFTLKCYTCGSKIIDSRCTNKNCKPYSLYCSLCQLPVKGLSMCCYICGHGGHFDHYYDWFKESNDCPFACGCKCMFYI